MESGQGHALEQRQGRDMGWGDFDDGETSKTNESFSQRGTERRSRRNDPIHPSSLYERAPSIGATMTQPCGLRDDCGRKLSCITTDESADVMTGNRCGLVRPETARTRRRRRKKPVTDYSFQRPRQECSRCRPRFATKCHDRLPSSMENIRSLLLYFSIYSLLFAFAPRANSQALVLGPLRPFSENVSSFVSNLKDRFTRDKSEEGQAATLQAATLEPLTGTNFTTEATTTRPTESALNATMTTGIIVGTQNNVITDSATKTSANITTMTNVPYPNANNTQAVSTRAQSSIKSTLPVTSSYQTTRGPTGLTSSTAGHTPHPTVPSTDEPTTPPPTVSPTDEPTTSSPTFSPTDEPTASLTKAPTSEPTVTITPDPTVAPTMSPTTSPTATISSIPSRSPSSNPTYVASTTPTVSPTALQSSIPSPEPSSSPTSSPSLAPSITPSKSQTPSISNSALPTQPPSLSSSLKPTSSPSRSPTQNPSTAPSSAPTKPLQEDTIFNMIMTFDDCSPLKFGSIQLWRRLTAQHIQEEFQMKVNEEYELYDVNVTVYFVDQSTPLSKKNVQARSSRDDDDGGFRRRWLRRTQSTLAGKTPLRIRFDVVVTFRSPSYDHDMIRYVSRSLDQIEDRIRYISLLQGSDHEDDSFNGINTLTVEIYGITIDTKDPPPPPPKNEDVPSVEGGTGNRSVWRNVWVIVACAVSGSALLLLVSFIGYRSHCQEKSKDDVEQNQNETISADSSRRQEEKNVERFIEVHGMDDVSTLGDPFGLGPPPPGSRIFNDNATVEQEETVGDTTLNCDYDYAKNFGAIKNCEEREETAPPPQQPPPAQYSSGALSASSAPKSPPPPSASAQESMHDNRNLRGCVDNPKHQQASLVFSDDDSFEEQFLDPEERVEIDCPPGKLGVVIDTAVGGVPSVQIVKDTSALAGKVLVGDALVSVDGEDTRCMTALEVSEIISSKAENPSRILVFVRNMRS